MTPLPESIIRPHHRSDAGRSDRSAGDRLRHRQKVREAIRENIADIIAEESIIGKSRDKLIKVPIRGVKEYRFVYGDNTPGVAQGGGDSEPGQVVGKSQGDGKGQPDRAGDRPGVDYYETEVTLDELTDIMFEDLELPDLERKKLREVPSLDMVKRKGYRRVGVRARLDKRRTVRSRIKRRLAIQTRPEGTGEVSRFPFHDEDLVYRHVNTDIRRESNAVVFCIMDTSGSMDTMKRYLARRYP
jgi:uncharacterized sporulation protein YeaH/YhbH (DUF444 family)